MIMNLMYLLILLIIILISVAFLTLLERKILGYMQMRMGPNKNFFMGFLQPFNDAIKLFSKEILILNNINFYPYFISPLVLFTLSFFYWLIYPFYSNNIMFNYNLIYMYFLMSISIYPMVMMGWSSGSLYSLIGSLRSMAQSISFEISLFLMLICMFMLMENFSLMKFFNFQMFNKFILMMLPIYFMMLISMLIELNRTPFDLIEGESELVSGFNIEYFSMNFSLIFLSEYMNIIFMSMILTIMFLNFSYSLLTLIMFMWHLFIIIWMRGTLPRIRYDSLMYMCWKKFLIITLFIFMMIFFIKMIYMYSMIKYI